jgi:Condensation domain
MLGSFETLGLARGDHTECRATVGQEYFFHLAKQDPDPRAFAHSSILLLQGALDRDRLARAIEVVVEQHSIYRTTLVEQGGVVIQRVQPATSRPDVEILDRTCPEPGWRAACEDIWRARAAEPFEGYLARAVIVVLASDRHALILTIHHAVSDGGSLEAFLHQLFGIYAGAARAEAPLQYIDYAAALEAWADGPDGRAQRERWAARLAGATPLVLPVDHARDELDALRASVPHGIVAETMHPVQHVELPAAVTAGVARLARAERTSAFAVYLAALGGLLRELSGQDDVCIESSYSPRFNLRLHRQLAPVHGLLTTWTIARVELAGTATLADEVRRARATANELQELGPIWDYYRVVPVGVRRAIFNYVPLLSPARAELAPGLQGARLSPGFPIWKRPWELHLTVIDNRATSHLFWTGNARLFREDTTRRWLDALLDRLGRGVGA